jgi:hypothetical protein
VPNIESICISLVFSEKLNDIKFQGNPVKIKLLINSIIPNKSENIKNDTITFFE